MPDEKAPAAIPLYLPNREQANTKPITVLAGDVGGTKTNLAIFKTSGDTVEVVEEKKFHSANYDNCVDIVKEFISSSQQPAPDRISLGVAGPVVAGKVDLTNLGWMLDIDNLRNNTAIEKVVLINDLEATAYGLCCLSPSDLLTIHTPKKETPGNMAIIAPGTGLGEAGIFWDGKHYHPFATEGGHTDFGPRTALDMELYDYLQNVYGVVSWERVLSGPGIYEIYKFLRDVMKRQEPSGLTTALQDEEDPAAVISHTALQGQTAICTETMNLFVRYLARECSNLVLQMKATGGLFLGGGIPPKIAKLLQQDFFYIHYMNCDRLKHLLEDVPIHIITNEKTALIGAACYGAYGNW